MTQRDYYQVLGIPRAASPADVRAAYARLARHHHPDVVGALPARLHDVQEAYHCLADPARRAAHDRAIAEEERRHAARQRSIQRRLHGYDRRHPHAPPRPGRRWGWRSTVVLLVGVAVAARVSWTLLG